MLTKDSLCLYFYNVFIGQPSSQTPPPPFFFLFVFVFGLKCSYAEVRAEQRRELGIEEANPEVTADKVRNK